MIEDRKLKMSDEFSDKKLSEEDASHTFLAREIVQEIRKFGVSQLTLMKTIELLALELEDRGRMLAIVGAVKGNIDTSGSPILSE
jgi:hypothetical protein